MIYLAHVRKLDNGQWAEPQLLEDHLRETAELAAGFAEGFGSREWGYALGMLHDGCVGLKRVYKQTGKVAYHSGR